MASPPSPIQAPKHILDLLSQLHKESLAQEALLNPTHGKFTSSDASACSEAASYTPISKRPDFDNLMLDKFIALDEDKCHFMYQLAIATGASNIVEAGTSFGISTIYLALAVERNKERTGKSGKVIATEKETEKAAIAREYWKKCGKAVEGQIELREGDLLKTLEKDLPEVDMLLLDIWAALALQTLKVVQPKLRRGAVILTDNTISSSEGTKSCWRI